MSKKKKPWQKLLLLRKKQIALSRRALAQRKILSDPQGASSNSLLFASLPLCDTPLSSQAVFLTACFPLRLTAVTACVRVCVGACVYGAGGGGGGGGGGDSGGVCV